MVEVRWARGRGGKMAKLVEGVEWYCSPMWRRRRWVAVSTRAMSWDGGSERSDGRRDGWNVEWLSTYRIP